MGDADTLFLKHNVIALGWAEMGDLSSLPAERDAFRNRWMEAKPGLREKQYIGGASQIFRFVHEAKKSDLATYPSKKDRRVHIGEIIDAYKYDPKLVANYPQHRPVRWLGDFPRTRFSQGANS